MATQKTDKKPIVIKELRRHGIIERAARTAGISSQTIRRWQSSDKDFASEMEIALEAGRE